MKSDFEIHLKESTLYVYLGDELMTENAPELQEELKHYLGRDITKIVFDATDLVYLSSSGIRVITYAYQNLGHSPEIEFVNCAEKMYDVLDIIGMTKIISFVEDESKRRPINILDSELQERLTLLNQEQLDYFTANNDVVMYQMKLGQDE